MFEKSHAYYDAIYSFKDYGAEARKVREIIERYKRSRGRDLLDVACGTGAHLVHFRRWFNAEGIDLDSRMVALARLRAKGVRVRKGDMRTFKLPKQFDAVVCLFGSVGYLKTVKGLDQTVTNLARHTKPGGVVLVEPWITPASFRKKHVGAVTAMAGEASVTRVHRSTRSGRTSHVEFHYTVANAAGVRKFVEHHELGLFTDAEYRRAFERAGLKVKVYKRGLMGRGLLVGVKPQRANR